MSLVENTHLLATRIGAEFKTVRAEASAIASARYTKAEADAAIQAAVDALINGAPGALDTLNELAAALGNNADFAATLTSQLALKANASDVEASLALKADADGVYTIAEVNSAITQAVNSSGKVDAGTLSSTDVSVYADSSRTPQPDPRGFGGWYFKNIAAGQKINWYPYNGGAVLNGSPSYGELSSMWAVFTFYNTTSAPFLNVYSKRTGTGDAASWYKSRWVFDTYTGSIPAGTTSANPSKMLVFWGVDPGVHPELPRLQIRQTLAFTSNGTRAPSEEIFLYSWGTNSAAAVGLNDFTVEQLGHKMRDQLVSHSLVHIGASIADLALKANSADVYTKAAVDSALSTKADASSVYSVADADLAISTAINNLIGAAPGTLDTLAEIAAAIESDQTAAAALAQQVALKANAADVHTKTEVYTKAEVDSISGSISTGLGDGFASANFVATFEAALVA